MELFFIIVMTLFSFNQVICEAERQFYVASYVDNLDILSSLTETFDFTSNYEYDITVLSLKGTPIPHSDKMLNFLSNSARKGRMYVAASLLEQVSCDNGPGSIRNNLVFNKNGDLIASTRRLSNDDLNCNIKQLNITNNSTEPTMFTTDFGVTFALLMEEDLLLQKPEKFPDVKNFIVPEISGLDLPFYDELQLPSSWAFSNQANLLTGIGIFDGEKHSGMAVLLKNGRSEYKPFHSTTSEKSSFEEDLTVTSIKYTSMFVGSHDQHTTACHEEFCCQFHFEVSSSGLNEVYKIFVFNGVTSIGRYNIGVQNCIVTPTIGSESDITFHTITIVANYTKGNAQYPIISSGDESNSITFDKKSTIDSDTVTISITNARKITGFGIFGRDYNKDSDKVYSIISEVVEFFDYVWVRLRILIFVASIYVLEMM